MIETETLLTGGIGLLTTVVSAWASWIFARKRGYKAFPQTVSYVAHRRNIVTNVS